MKSFSVLTIFCVLVTMAAQSQVFKAELDKQFDNGSNINSIPLDAQRINDLAVLGKVWGYVKYYHSAVNKGDHNWDYELFRVLPMIMECKNDKERNRILNKWIGKLGHVELAETKLPDTAEVKLYPDLKWIEDATVLGEPLSARLQTLKNAKRITNGYYNRNVVNYGNPDLKNEARYNQTWYPDAGFRLLALYRYWNIIQYLFPYRYLIEEDWKNVLTEFIPVFVNAADEFQYKLAILTLIARIHDTHATIANSDAVFDRIRGKFIAPLEISFVENKAVVTGYLPQELGRLTGLKKGDIIISVNGKSTETIIKEKWPISSASNDVTKLRNIGRDLLSANDTTMSITYQRENTTYSTKLTGYTWKTINSGYATTDTCFKFITPDIAYINPDNIKNDYLSKVMPDFMKTKGMIFDMRYYPNDNIFFIMAKYLLPEPVPFVKMAFANVEMPGAFVFRRKITIGTQNPDYYKGRVVIIVNEKTQSSAEYTSMALRVSPGAVVIGSTTAAADGDVSRFYLPGGIRTAFSGIGIYYPDKRETQRIGIVPDITVHPTIKGITEGRDELLEKAIELINGK